jgi:hypothetical protein
MMKFSKVGIKLKMMKFLVYVGTNDDYFFRVYVYLVFSIILFTHVRRRRIAALRKEVLAGHCFLKIIPFLTLSLSLL